MGDSALVQRVVVSSTATRAAVHVNSILPERSLVSVVENRIFPSESGIIVFSTVELITESTF